MKRDPFIFTVTDLARFLGKSAVTIRKWEAQGLIELPRDTGDNRKLTADEVREVGKIAFHLKRITRHRLDMIEATCTLLSLIEGEN
jgi:DNA-binding transcriptional MerR regulator